MDDASVQQRLSQIATAWTLVARAHGGSTEAEGVAQAALVERYQTAVYRYLLAAVREPDVADELFQEFALRLVRGDFGRADPNRGRFRDYIKSAVINLVINHQQKQKKRRAVASDGVEPAAPQEHTFDSDREFLASWRKSLLDRAWESLAKVQQPDGIPFHTILRFRTDHPELSGTELVDQLNAQRLATQPYSEAGLRKILQRAREKFTDLLVDEVAHSMRSPTLDQLEQELIDLGFQAYCRRALERRRQLNPEQ